MREAAMKRSNFDEFRLLVINCIVMYFIIFV